MLKLKGMIRLIWSLDALEVDPKLDPATIRQLSLWRGHGQLEIYPVYIFLPYTQAENLGEEGLSQRLRERLNGWGLPDLEPKVIPTPHISMTDAVEALLAECRSLSADAIIVSSHGRTGLSRLMFGSFVEKLLTISPIPLLCLNREPLPLEAKANKAVFATDFSSSCEAAFDHFLKTMAPICSDIVIYHDLSLMSELAAFSARWDFEAPSEPTLVEAQRDWVKEQSEHWLAKASSAGIKAVYAQKEGSSNVAKSISEAAHAFSAGFVVMASHEGPFSAVLFGSHARQVLRASEFPALIYGPSQSL